MANLMNAGCELGPLDLEQRKTAAKEVRQKSIDFNFQQPRPERPCNGDEERYKNQCYFANFSKTLPHNQLGEVQGDAYEALLNAIHSGQASDFEAVPSGGIERLANPLAAYAYQLEGLDSHQTFLAAPPAFASEAAAAEMVELYWASLLRDVPFREYDTHAGTLAAAAELSRFSPQVLQVPRDAEGRVTPQTLFRGDFYKVTVGPYVSQFLLKDFFQGAQPIVQQIRTVVPGRDYMTKGEEWLSIQNGQKLGQQDAFDPIRRYIRSARDLGEWVHRDFQYQAALHAALILLSENSLSPTNPYRNGKFTRQAGFATLGAPFILDLLARVGKLSLYAAWFFKWAVHRKLRPEVYGGRVHFQATGRANYGVPTTLLNSHALQAVYSKYGSYLLPQAFPEGSPAHPSYPAGHGAFAGATITVLKALFNGDKEISNPVQANPDGRFLEPYTGKDCDQLTVEGELNKLALNIFRARDLAGVHYGSDGREGALLGEQVALYVLRDLIPTLPEPGIIFEFCKFDGQKVRITRDKVEFPNS